MRQTRGSLTNIKLHRDWHSDTSISNLVKNIYVGSNNGNVKTVIRNRCKKKIINVKKMGVSKKRSSLSVYYI